MDETRGEDPSTTTRPVIVLVSVPERKRDVEKNRQKLPTKDAFLGHVQSDDVSDIDYVKTIHKGDIAKQKVRSCGYKLKNKLYFLIVIYKSTN